MLKAQNISIGYGKRNSIFSGINFTARPGDMIALLGVNGIGKSTLLRTLAGLQMRTGGTLELNGADIHRISAGERARHISIVLTERLHIDNISVHALIALGRAPYTGLMGQLTAADLVEINSVIKVMRLEPLQHRYFNQLSDGEKQKVLIARALCQQTPVIILDEPTAFLDFRNKRVILDTLKTISYQLNKTIIFSTHDIDASLENCNVCWIMKEDKTFKVIERSPDFRKDVMEALDV